MVLDPAFDGVLEARTACGAVATAIDCDDVVSGNEVLIFGVSAGQPLYIIVDGYNAAAVGTFTLSINPAETVCNDGLDDNANGLEDCEDPGCLSDASCAPVTAACTAAPALAATQTGDTTASGSNFSSDIAGSFCGFGSGVNDAVYSYTAPGAGLLDLGLTGDTGQGLYVRTDCDDALARISCNNLSVSPDQLYATLLPGQSVWVYVDGSTAGDIGPYTLTSNFIAFTSTEVEPNNGPASANPAAATNTGIITPAESDWYAVTVPGPASILDAETVDTVTAPNLCTSQSADTFITIYAADGTTVLDTDEDGGDGYCSAASATALAAGTYYVRVQGSPSYAFFDQMAYQLDITVTP
ncbi:MAG: pre-peptidase C-terminal domain-containing protein [Polyangiaceae bacterium]